MKSLLSFVFLSTFVLFSLGCANTSKKASSENIQEAYLHQDIAMGYLKADKYPAALEQLLIAKKLAPHDANITNNLAIAYQFRGRSDIAIETFKKALNLDPSLTDARSNLAQAYIEKKMYSEALEQLLIARDDLTYQNPEKIHTNLGITYFHLSNFSKANDELNLALKANREFCQAKFYKLKTLFELKKFSDSSKMSDHNVYACPKEDLEQTYYIGGMSYYLNGQLGQAEDRLQNLVNKYPSSDYAEKAHLALAAIKVKKNERNR
ncbi:MAG: tetratricopeptide repeat protein [Bdellovibrionota bacterium]|nr:tetratricopeptide repeat protein [Bdellovibrionota bacterium]